MNSNKAVQYPFACKYDRADWNRSELTDYLPPNARLKFCLSHHLFDCTSSGASQLLA